MKLKFAAAISILAILAGTAMAVGSDTGHGLDLAVYNAMSLDEKRCADLQGFYKAGSCFSFEGTTKDGGFVEQCAGKCALWGRCMTSYPEIECKRARNAKENYEKSLIEKDKSTS